MIVLTLLLYSPLIYLLHLLVTSLISLRKNYNAVLKIGLPFSILPVYEVNTFFKLTQPIHEPIIKFLGLGDSVYFKFFYMDWFFKTRYSMFEHFGDMVLTVSPAYTVITTADAEVALQLSGVSGGIEKPIQLYSRINFMGENVVASEGAQWRRFRRISAPPFNEEVMSTVWSSALAQALPLQRKWSGLKAAAATYKDVTRVTLNVICSAGFGVDVPFDSKDVSERPAEPNPELDEFFTSPTPPKGYHFNFGGAILHLLSNVVTILAAKLMFSEWFLMNGPVPRSVKDGVKSLVETNEYIRQLVRRETKRHELGYYKQDACSPGSGKRRHFNLLTTLTNPDTPGRLSEDEAIANAFIMALAGHETTANTLVYSTILLATFPEKQDWFLKQLDEAIEGLELEEWTYEGLFPRLVPCLCIMHETLRLFPPVTVLARWSGHNHASIKYSDRVLQIPPQTMLNISLPGLQQNPKYWGKTHYGFHPDIWDARSAEGWTEETSNQLLDETTSLPYRHIRRPVQGSYMPFSEGRRGCLGKKFAQVEFSLILAVLFRKQRVELVLKSDETLEMAKERAWGVLMNSVSLLSLQVQDHVPVKWVPR